MSTQKEREAIKVIFKDPSKVNDMSDAQVIAIYKRLLSQGKLGPKR
jgi:hypothetical protein